MVRGESCAVGWLGWVKTWVRRGAEEIGGRGGGQGDEAAVVMVLLLLLLLLLLLMLLLLLATMTWERVVVDIGGAGAGKELVAGVPAGHAPPTHRKCPLLFRSLIDVTNSALCPSPSASLHCSSVVCSAKISARRFSSCENLCTRGLTVSGLYNSFLGPLGVGLEGRGAAWWAFVFFRFLPIG